MSDFNDEAFLKELRATFAVEAHEHLQTLAAGLIELEGSDQPERQQALIETIFREVHSLKGAARAVENRAVETLCQSMESILSALKHRRIEFRLELADLLHEAMDALSQLLTTTAAALPKTMLVLCSHLDSAALGEPPLSVSNGNGNTRDAKSLPNNGDAAKAIDNPTADIATASLLSNPSKAPAVSEALMAACLS